jgi:uncharacterized protein (TIGR02145 family)
MKKIFTLILGITLAYSCSTSSDGNGNSNTPVVPGPTALNVPGPNVTDIDGNTYQSVTNCGQTWTKQNLNVSKYNDGTPIPQVTSIEWRNLTTGAWCYYNNDTANGAVYGKLYNWYAVAGIYDAASATNTALRKKLAPAGWHIPTDTEWTTLTTCLGGVSVAGDKMKSTGTFQAGTGLWNYLNNASNQSGFSGFPGGYRAGSNLGTAPFSSIRCCGFWWTSTEYLSSSNLFAWNRELGNSSIGDVGRSSEEKKYGFSVRCIKD